MNMEVIEGPWVTEAESATDAMLVSRARAGDGDAFGVLYNRYRLRIRAVIAQVVGYGEDADDLTQDVFVKAFAALPRFRGDSRFFTWMYRIARNTALNFVGRRSAELRNTESLEPATDIGPERLCIAAQSQQNAANAIGGLPAHLRDALVLNAVRGFDYESVSSLLECPLGTVRSRISRARGRLADVVAD